MDSSRLKETHKAVSDMVSMTIKGLMLSTEAADTPEFSGAHLMKELQLNVSILEEETLRDIAVLLISEKAIDFMKESGQFAVVAPEDMDSMRDLIKKIKEEFRDRDHEPPTL